jgi:leader peptidase (prepilin peptidase)/N-methyltransferase
LLSAVLWVTAGLRFGFSAQTAWAVALFYLLLILSFIDLDTMRLPNTLVALLFAIGLVGAAISQFSEILATPLVPLGDAGIWASPLAVSVIGAAASAGVALAIAGAYALVRRKEGFGMGDAKLLGAIGVFLGLYGVLVLFAGSIIGATYGVIAAR